MSHSRTTPFYCCRAMSSALCFTKQTTAVNPRLRIAEGNTRNTVSSNPAQTEPRRFPAAGALPPAAPCLRKCRCGELPGAALNATPSLVPGLYAQGNSKE